jgi:nitrile hydratase accessory protein
LSSSEEAAFDEPWHAQVFALVVQLQANGAFTWAEWAEALAAEIAAARGASPAEEGPATWRHWLGALEGLVSRLGLTQRALADRKAAWAEAYARTPHGRPVELLAR